MEKKVTNKHLKKTEYTYFNLKKKKHVYAV